MVSAVMGRFLCLPEFSTDNVKKDGIAETNYIKRKPSVESVFSPNSHELGVRMMHLEGAHSMTYCTALIPEKGTLCTEVPRSKSTL